jgi:hypothetical protein
VKTYLKNEYCVLQKSPKSQSIGKLLKKRKLTTKIDKVTKYWKIVEKKKLTSSSTVLSHKAVTHSYCSRDPATHPPTVGHVPIDDFCREVPCLGKPSNPFDLLRLGVD